MKSTVVDESLSSYKPMYCSREYQTSTRLNQQYEKSTLNLEVFNTNWNWVWKVLEVTLRSGNVLGKRGN